MIEDYIQDHIRELIIEYGEEYLREYDDGFKEWLKTNQEFIDDYNDYKERRSDIESYHGVSRKD